MGLLPEYLRASDVEEGDRQPGITLLENTNGSDRYREVVG